MRTTKDTYTGKSFRWNEVTFWPAFGLNAPARYTARTAVQLHPTRVPVALLRELNPDTDVEAALGVGAS